MTRVDTPLQTISVKPKSANLSRFLTIICLTLVALLTYFVCKGPLDILGDPSDQFLVRNIPKTYTRLEEIDAEDREVFHEFRTSFLPFEEDIISSQFDSTVESHENVDKYPQVPNRRDHLSKRSKRKIQLSHSAEDYNDGKPRNLKTEDDIETDSTKESEIEEAFDPNENNKEDGTLHNAAHPELYVDRGPLDDVEQVRRLPELEEGEMSAAAFAFKPVTSYTGVHAFWKGQGDKETIRNTQAKIMKHYMDAEADPCHDFFQYACGNWAQLNPIPPDKAGYDTFEMLRENLDVVLRDLLELKNDEFVSSNYPGGHLNIDQSFVNDLSQPRCQNNVSTVDTTSEIAENYDDLKRNQKNNKSEIINRIKRYLDNKVNHKNNGASEVKLNKKEDLCYSKKHPRSFQRKGKKNLNNKVKRIEGTKTKRQKRYIWHGPKLLGLKKDTKPQRFIRDVNFLFLKFSRGPHDDPAHGDATLKARYLFKSCMNHDILHRRGHQPLLDLLELFGGWPIIKPTWNNKHFDWLELMAKLRLFNNDILISQWVGPDIRNSNENVIQFDQTSLGLPTRDYFLQGSNKVYLDAYKNYLMKIAILLGGESKHVKQSAVKIIEFEKQLAKITSAPEDRRNVSELYRRMPLSKLSVLVPEVDWRRYLCIVMKRNVENDETVVLFALNYVQHLVQLIKKTEAGTLANYLLWRFVRHRVNNLDDRFQSAKQQFYFILFGREQAPPRWKNCISQVNSNMGMALGSMFVRKYFDEKSKNDTLKMTREIQQSFRDLLHKTNWIDDETKKLAAHKVDSMMLRIGYPGFILKKRDLDERYKEVRIHPDKYFENILNILQHLTKMEQARIGQPVNKTLWNTAPAVVNAYYSRNKNQIMFPAGILQPPFYHRHFPRSLNFGGIGVVIGHEITHGFDDKGRLFDCEGNLHRWWSDPAIEAFHKRAQCLIDQYGRYIVPEVNMKLDGINTQGENIADNGGVKQAFHAYLNWLQGHDAEDETLPGLNHTRTQLFFLNFAQVWCGAMRPEAMRNKLKTAVHSPGRFRVIGTLSNSEDFAREFNCPPGSPMNPSQKCSVW
ncbi:neprilysin-4-like [Leptidea sinapis]|uniref:neprilysin-4-like n=1 Tax=Leptidea sinapis TaxID=189913 RepID=UPI0021C2BC02|nr:neprilysin-4-like [Leptidea sinapis]